MIKCVIFDMDGVLINTEPVHFRIWEQICAEHGFTLAYDCYKKCIGSTTRYLHDLIQEWYGVSFHDNSQIRTRFVELKAQSEPCVQKASRSPSLPAPISITLNTP